MSNLKKAEAIATKFNKIMFALAIIGVLCVLVFGKKTNKQQTTSVSSPTSTESISSSSTRTETNTRTIYVDGDPITVDMTQPSGYDEGFTCDLCYGSGVTTNLSGKGEMICPACAGKGFKWHKKSNY